MWDIFGIDAIRFSPAMPVLRELYDAVVERDSSWVYKDVLVPGDRLTDRAAKELISAIDAWVDTRFGYFADYRVIYGKSVLARAPVSFGQKYYELMGINRILPGSKGWLFNAAWAAQIQEALDLMRCLNNAREDFGHEPDYFIEEFVVDNGDIDTPIQTTLAQLTAMTESTRQRMETSALHETDIVIDRWNWSLIDTRTHVQTDSKKPFDVLVFFKHRYKNSIISYHIDGINDEENYFLLNTVNNAEPEDPRYFPDSARASIQVTPRENQQYVNISISYALYSRLDVPGGLQKVTPWVPPEPDPEPEEPSED